jgi:hypothetical protein
MPLSGKAEIDARTLRRPEIREVKQAAQQN